MYWHHSGWAMVAIALTTLWFWGLVVAAIVLLVRFNGRGAARDAARDTDPEQILAQRFAKGEIDQEEYQRRLAVLRGAGGPAPQAPPTFRAGH